MTPIEYVTEEVQRQGHDTCQLDGIKRVGWMLEGWSYAIGKRAKLPTLIDAIQLGKYIERRKNAGGLRKCGVRVGHQKTPTADEVRERLPRLFSYLENRRSCPNDLGPYSFYREFELIHPFADGNGRVGKILLNWLNRTLFNPVFPPNDFWGEEIRNP